MAEVVGTLLVLVLAAAADGMMVASEAGSVDWPPANTAHTDSTTATLGLMMMVGEYKIVRQRHRSCRN